MTHKIIEYVEDCSETSERCHSIIIIIIIIIILVT